MNEETYYDWDDSKAETNYRKHGIDFETATEAFDDHFALQRLDPFSVD